eukprot:TRINITY_DN1797_c0_g1_i2.p1 TRINITY_DN1797_c0_g1~~TRINITY_DN1797_c0_g1_i2.p1  ORF type:complete len:114 (+),score=44.19 TRINITY_DN1797_c0_g1_i2:2-343(+)
MQSKVRLPQPERPKIIQEAITIMSEMRLPLGLYQCNSDDDASFNNASISCSSSPSARSIVSSFSESFSSFSSSSCSSSSSSSTSSSSSAANSIATHHTHSPPSPQIKIIVFFS